MVNELVRGTCVGTRFWYS